jgi:hypothetical protein
MRTYIGRFIDGFDGMQNIYTEISPKDSKIFGDGFQLFGKTVIGMIIIFLRF